MKMVGIGLCGSYIPYFRLDRGTIAKIWGRGSIGGERSVANNDEDGITMAVAAGMDCFMDIKRETVDNLYLASTTFPNKERGNASIAVAASNLSSNTRTAEFSGCLKYFCQQRRFYPYLRSVQNRFRNLHLSYQLLN